MLLLAMIGAILLTFRERVGVKKQSYLNQISRDPSNAVELIEVKSNQGVKVDDWNWFRTLFNTWSNNFLFRSNGNFFKQEKCHSYFNVNRVDGIIEEVEIIRDVVELEESYAKSSLIIKDNNKYGLIELPQFYIDFDDYSNRNAATDVKKEINQLKEKDVQGIIIDLRNNGGGSLKTVVDMTGYFIDKGPVVQVKSTGGRKEVLRDVDPSIVWDGPLVILGCDSLFDFKGEAYG